MIPGGLSTQSRPERFKRWPLRRSGSPPPHTRPVAGADEHRSSLLVSDFAGGTVVWALSRYYLVMQRHLPGCDHSLACLCQLSALGAVASPALEAAGDSI